MKRILIFIFCLGSWLLSFAQGTGFVRLQGKQFKDVNGNDFYPLIMNVPFEVINYGGNVMLSNALQSEETNQRDCNNPSECEADIVDCFEKVQDMGFNCIRVMGLEPRFVTNHAGFKGFVHRVVEFPWAETFIPLEQPYATDDETELLIDQYVELLEIAAQMPQPFYVILNTLNYYNQDVYTQDAYEINVIDPYYAEFLSVVATRLQQYPSLMAYDLFNEPYLSDIPLHTKGNICTLVDGWSTAIKLNDDDHLITINNIWIDIIEWEPAVMKVDFYSVHIYNKRDGDLEPTGAIGYTESLNRVHGMAQWLSANCAMPWIIGEIGFSCFNVLQYPDVDGTKAQQSAFAQATLDIVRNCGGSGYSWWKLQESNYGAYQDGFGLLYNSYSFTATASTTTEKPAVDVFRHYLTNNMAPEPVALAPCSTYYDPFNHGFFNQAHTNAVTGTILDVDGNPIENALIQGLNWLDTDNSNGPPVYSHSWIYTFSNSNISNNFELVPYSSEYPNNSKLLYIRGSANGGERFERPPNSYPWTDIPMNPTNVPTITLHFANPLYDVTVNNEFINIGVTQSFTGLSTLTVSNTTIDGNGSTGGTSDMTARNAVIVNSEFHAKKGSDVHIFISETFVECFEVDAFSEARIGFSDNDNQIGTKEIELKFNSPDPGTIDALIIPNPTSGIFTVKLFNNIEGKVTVLVKNPQGQQMQESSTYANNIFLDGSALAKGIYFIEIKMAEKSITKKLIIN